MTLFIIYHPKKQMVTLDTTTLSQMVKFNHSALLVNWEITRMFMDKPLKSQNEWYF